VFQRKQAVDFQVLRCSSDDLAVALKALFATHQRFAGLGGETG
jgi:hypothetical protein